MVLKGNILLFSVYHIITYYMKLLPQNSQPVLITCCHIPTFCPVPFASYLDAQGTPLVSLADIKGIPTLLVLTQRV